MRWTSHRSGSMVHFCSVLVNIRSGTFMFSVVAEKKAPPTDFGVRLRDRRQAAGLTQAALGELVGMKGTAVRRLETSPDANPTLETVRKLAKALDCSMSDLTGD